MLKNRAESCGLTMMCGVLHYITHFLGLKMVEFRNVGSCTWQSRSNTNTLLYGLRMNHVTEQKGSITRFSPPKYPPTRICQ